MTLRKVLAPLTRVTGVARHRIRIPGERRPRQPVVAHRVRVGVTVTLAAAGVVLPFAMVYEDLAADGQHTTVLAVLAATVAVLVVLRMGGLATELRRRRRVEAELSRRQDMIELLQAVSAAANCAGSDRLALHDGLRAVCRQLGWPAGVAHLGDHRHRVASTSAYLGTDPELIEELFTDAQRLPLTDNTVARAMATQRPVCSHDLAVTDAARERPVRVAVPIMVGDEVVGALEFVVDGPRPFALPRDLHDTLAAVGTQLGRVVERARHRQEATARAEELARANTVLQQANQAEEHGRREAEHRNAAKSEFLAHMTHEVRTPLNAILGFAQLLEADGQDISAQQREFISYIARSGRHVLELVNGLLDISRIETGHLDLTIEDLPVVDLVADAAATVSPGADDRAIEVVTDVPPHLCIRADAQRTFQVLLNLFSNGIKYNRDGGMVTVAATDVPGEMVRLTVDDTGPGIAPELVPRLFQAFDRLDATDEVEGTGLGLVVSRQLVEAMNGHIGVSSQTGVGTQFWIELPRGGVAPDLQQHSGPAPVDTDLDTPQPSESEATE